MPASVHAAIERLGARAIRAEREFFWELEGQRWNYRGLGTTLRDLPAPALTGAVQYRNAATALAALEALGISISQAGERARPCAACGYSDVFRSFRPGGMDS